MRHFLDTRNILWRNILNENLNAINTRITERIKGNDRNSAFSSINLPADQCLLTASHALSAILNCTHASEEDAVPIFHEPEVNKESSSNFVKESITPMGDVTMASQNVEDELLKTARSWDEYTFLLCKKHNINPLIVIFLACLFSHVLVAFINRLVQPPDHTEQIIQCLENLTLEIRSFRRTIEQKLPENPKGYLRVVTRRVKFTTNDNQVIFLNCEDKIFVEYDAKKYVCGTVLIDGKFIKGYCLKKYTKRVIE